MTGEENRLSQRLIRLGGWLLVGIAVLLALFAVIVQSPPLLLGPAALALAAWPHYRFPWQLRAVGFGLFPVLFYIGLDDYARSLDLIDHARIEQVEAARAARADSLARWDVIGDSVLALARDKLEAGETDAAREVLAPWFSIDPAVRELDREVSEQQPGHERTVEDE